MDSLCKDVQNLVYDYVYISNYQDVLDELKLKIRYRDVLEEMILEKYGKFYKTRFSLYHFNMFKDCTYLHAEYSGNVWDDYWLWRKLLYDRLKPILCSLNPLYTGKSYIDKIPSSLLRIRPWIANARILGNVRDAEG